MLVIAHSVIFEKAAIKPPSPLSDTYSAYIQDIVNRFAEDGWEFYRIDSVGVSLQPGCLGGLSGQKAQNSIYYVISFRKEV